MVNLGDRIRTRVLPALLTASGVTLLAAGLLSYIPPVAAEPAPTQPPASASPSAAATPSPLITLPPLSSLPPPSASPSADPDRVATRVRVAALDIDMPIVEGPAGYPYCDVAMYLKELKQPGQGGATYLFGHARAGMFLPLLETPEKTQLGMVVEVWTSDDYRFLYEIVDVRRAQTSLDDPLSADSEELWLQTSEGPRGTVGKTQVVAEPLSVERADPKDAHPTPKPVDCG
ncbi:MAG: sortase [Candidatus Limnocylindrales bacterium]